MSSELNSELSQERSRLRWTIYGILIAISVGNMTGRILAVNAIDRGGIEKVVIPREIAARKADLTEQGLSEAEIAARLPEIEALVREEKAQQRPFLSANDRSRWATVRSLVELGTYEIDEIIAQPNWDTIDMVQHVGDDGELHLYSSKPPLLATLIAGEYWVIHKLTGATLGTHPYEIGRSMLITINVLPMILLFVLVAKFAERFGQTDWGRIFIVASACLATFLSTFAVVLNNHTTAAVSTAIAVHCAWRIWYDGERRWSYFFFAGLFAAFTAANELPALSFFGLLSVGLLWKAPKLTLAAYVPGALIVGAAFFGTNYIAHESWRPPYAHREEGDNWYDYEYTVVRDGKPRVIESYWRPGKQAGIDRGEVSESAYVLHALVGHHGLFSLTPLWLLLIPSFYWLIARGPYRMPAMAFMVAVLTIVVLAFYLSRPQIDRNYGGMTSGLRWMFWFAPLWLMAMVPAADNLASARWKRGVGLTLLALSVMSASYPTWNPWTHPWIMNFLLHLGVVSV